MNQEKVWNKIAKPWREFKNIKPIEEVTEFLKNKKRKILDLGCGSGRNFVKTEGKIYAVDFSEKMLKHAKRHAENLEIDCEFIKANAWELPFKDNFFDSAIFVAVLHCIPEKERREETLKELLRVLKHGAEAFITVWDRNQPTFANSEKESLIPWKYEGKKHMRYYHLYDTEEFTELLKKAGFEIIQINDSENPNGFYSKRNIAIIVKKP
jgi:ubiquinone/menaquinone biosynthesis C-methylase UbiE